MQTLNYKGYVGSIEVSEADNCLYGEVIGLPKSVKITYEGETVQELKADFIRSVDDYMAECEANGIEPKRTYNGAFNVRVAPALHAQLDLLAHKNGLTLNKYVSTALARTAAEALQF